MHEFGGSSMQTDDRLGQVNDQGISAADQSASPVSSRPLEMMSLAALDFEASGGLVREVQPEEPSSAMVPLHSILNEVIGPCSSSFFSNPSLFLCPYQ